MTPTLEALRELEGRALPGGTISVDPHESRIADHALRAVDDDVELAHPLWFVIASLRGLGISVGELCALAGQAEGDTLLFGGVDVEQDRPLRVGGGYRTTAVVAEVGRRTTRDGSTLDSVVVRVDVLDDDGRCGTVTSTYLFRRAA